MIGRRGGQARARMDDFRQHCSNAGKASAAVNDMAALGAKGARAYIRKYGYIRFFHFWRRWKLHNPSRHEQQIMAILDHLGFAYQREAQVLGDEIPLAVDFYLPDANDAVIEVLGRIHYDPFFDHPNYPETRRGNDLHRLRRLERAGYRVLELSYQALAQERAAANKIVIFLLS
jgi:hypothetical protein